MHFPQKIMSSLKIQKAEAPALYRCMAYNKIGVDSRIIFFHVTRKICDFSCGPFLELISVYIMLLSIWLVCPFAHSRWPWGECVSIQWALRGGQCGFAVQGWQTYLWQPRLVPCDQHLGVRADGVGAALSLPDTAAEAPVAGSEVESAGHQCDPGAAAAQRVPSGWGSVCLPGGKHQDSGENLPAAPSFSQKWGKTGKFCRSIADLSLKIFSEPCFSVRFECEHITFKEENPPTLSYNYDWICCYYETTIL